MQALVVGDVDARQRHARYYGSTRLCAERVAGPGHDLGGPARAVLQRGLGLVVLVLRRQPGALSLLAAAFAEVPGGQRARHQGTVPGSTG